MFIVISEFPDFEQTFLKYTMKSGCVWTVLGHRWWLRLEIESVKHSIAFESKGICHWTSWVSLMVLPSPWGIQLSCPCHMNKGSVYDWIKVSLTLKSYPGMYCIVFTNKSSTKWTTPCHFVVLMYSGFACQQPFSWIARPHHSPLTGNAHHCPSHLLTVFSRPHTLVKHQILPV